MTAGWEMNWPVP